MDSLKKYLVQGQIQEELMKEMNDKKVIKESSQVREKSSNKEVYMHGVSKNLVENILREFEMSSMSVKSDTYDECDPRIKKSQSLIRLLQDAMWKIIDSNRKPYYSEEEMDDEIKALLISNQEPIIRACINKLYNMWITGEEQSEPQSQETTVIAVGQEIVSPKEESLVVESIQGDVIFVKTPTGEKRKVTKEIVAKWINS